MDCLESTFLIKETFRNELNFSENDKTDEMKFIHHFFDYLEPRIKATRYDYGFDLKPTRSFINDVSIIIDMYKLYCERTQDNDESELIGTIVKNFITFLYNTPELEIFMIEKNLKKYSNIFSGPLAQLVEHFPFKEGVIGSNPIRLTKFY